MAKTKKNENRKERKIQTQWNAKYSQFTKFLLKSWRAYTNCPSRL